MKRLVPHCASNARRLRINSDSTKRRCRYERAFPMSIQPNYGLDQLGYPDSRTSFIVITIIVIIRVLRTKYYILNNAYQEVLQMYINIS